MARIKMSREERAKQFMPFAALKGYGEALREKEKIIVPKAELSEEYLEELDYKIHQVNKKEVITVTYFHKGEYLKITGVVSRIDAVSRILRIANTQIAFDDICDIDIGQRGKAH